MATFLLFESTSGYAVFERVESDGVGAELGDVRRAAAGFDSFSKVCKLRAFLPFSSSEQAMENINAIAEGEVTALLRQFLEKSLPKAEPGKTAEYRLGVYGPRVGGVVQETMGIRCVSDDAVMECMRGIREHYTRFVEGVNDGDLQKAQLGLSQSISRGKVEPDEPDASKADDTIAETLAVLDQVDRDIDTFATRVREWYSWHFPELAKVVPDSCTFCRLVEVIGDRKTLDEDKLEAMTKVTGGPDKSREVLEAARVSMGADISETDLVNIERFATRVAKLSEYREELLEDLASRMNELAPNLSALVGEQAGARLVSHAGSLTNLAKYPASTVQILGAEKALFRALKAKGDAKYGLVYHSAAKDPRAEPKHKGRISRQLAGKASIASRIDALGEEPTGELGAALRAQVEERLARNENADDAGDREVPGDDTAAKTGDDDDDEEDGGSAGAP